LIAQEETMIVSTSLSIQESLYSELACFGCGQSNPHGLHLRSYREGDLTVAEFTPRPEHDNGLGIVNAGIIATVLDCHGAAAVMWEVAKQGWKTPMGTLVPFVTASFDVKFPRPTPLGRTVRLTASPESIDPSQIIVRSEIAVDSKVRAIMRATWARFRPR
jgi:acyl-coenzyme A thioesterase PaaI-like protein